MLPYVSLLISPYVLLLISGIAVSATSCGARAGLGSGCGLYFTM
jgi:hypothetical protein